MKGRTLLELNEEAETCKKSLSSSSLNRHVNALGRLSLSSPRRKGPWALLATANEDWKKDRRTEAAAAFEKGDFIHVVMGEPDKREGGLWNFHECQKLGFHLCRVASKPTLLKKSE